MFLVITDDSHVIGKRRNFLIRGRNDNHGTDRRAKNSDDSREHRLVSKWKHQLRSAHTGTSTAAKHDAANGLRRNGWLHKLTRMIDEPWYKDGLQFECTGCGNCCTGPAGYVWVTEAEIVQIAEFRKQSIGEIKIFHTRLVGVRISLIEFANGDCTFFDPETRRCTIYPVRPTQCRTWPFWHGNLRSPEAWNQMQRTCPGAGHGPLIPLEVIEAQANQLDL